MTPDAKMYTVFRNVVIHGDAPSEALPIADSQMERVRAEGPQIGGSILDADDAPHGVGPLGRTAIRPLI